ncbi:uncharacterized protein LOC100212358 isoform X2 [Hydra vulgaris]|uniref:Uncharacterized protein LOC100212358 isoform X2 n=1 Tax=Hydra vulgaris TaxID=6087 RepID=A0ABM4D1W3_HYDVU
MLRLTIYLAFLIFKISSVQNEFHWNAGEASKMSCVAPQNCSSCTLKKRSDKRNNFTDLGKVSDLEVCALLCCEIEVCDLALLENERCYSVSCYSEDSCETELVPVKNKNSLKTDIIKFRRKSGNDVWSSGSRKNQDDESISRIVTKQASVQKLANQKEIDQKDASITLSNKDKMESPMDALLQKESSIIRSKQIKQASLSKKEEISTEVNEKIQTVTEHYLKSQEKSDITALQENETVSHISKMSIPGKSRDLRHTLISPITIGAFTCMAVIAVSGFAMAIIKYQKERKEFQDKQTQKP